MKKSYIIRGLIMIIFASLVTYVIYQHRTNNHYSGYINERLNNLIKPLSDISQTNNFIKNAINHKEISTVYLNNIYQIYYNSTFNVQDVQEIEAFIKHTQNDGKATKKVLFDISDRLRVIRLNSVQTGNQMIKLNNKQILLFKNINQFNQKVLPVLQATLKQNFNVKEKNWIMVLKQLDEIVQQNKYDQSFYNS